MLRDVTDRFKALAHPARLRILSMLRSGPLCVCHLTEALALAPSTVSAHLAELRRSGLVKERKQGRFVHYALSREPQSARLLRSLWPELAEDPQVAADTERVAELRALPLEDLCRTGIRITVPRGPRSRRAVREADYRGRRKR